MAKEEPLTQTPVIPSAVGLLDACGEKAHIGQEAVNYNWDGAATGYAPSFKRYLGNESSRPMAVNGLR
ncbi:MAG: hypothetical protein NZT92_20215 [Abditibacteriales bacterium]|nr:hypothetical protein [Abditibacteriales bacterium]MDW8368077.1 hypothetical protein [Abditibacteriales bacterium]